VSPHLDFPPGFKGMMAGLWHSHLGWLFNVKLESTPMRYCPDLIRERSMRRISEQFIAIVAGGVVLAGLIGFAVGHTLTSFLTGMLWGGLVRIFLVNHITYAVNSVGHYFGRRRYPTADQSRNVAWLAVPSFGEAWHNNHHAFPRSARHGMRWYEVDITACTIWTLERFRLVTKVIRIDPERMALKEQGISRVVAGGMSTEEVLAGASTTPLADRDKAAAVSLTDVE
jgi:stearoyl-CoA desaturase (Delta-9 desaturase)